MKLFRNAAIAAASLAFAVASPASAQSEWPFTDAEYVEVSRINIDDGHTLDYAKHLAGIWRKGQDFAKAQGWIIGYEIMYNVHKRDGEPDVYLLTRFASFPSVAEAERRDGLYRAHMQTTEAQLQASSGERAKYRRQTGSTLLRKVEWKK